MGLLRGVLRGLTAGCAPQVLAENRRDAASFNRASYVFSDDLALNWSLACTASLTTPFAALFAWQRLRAMRYNHQNRLLRPNGINPGDCLSYLPDLLTRALRSTS